MEDKQKVIPFEVYAEATPNPLTLKFVANKLLVDGEDVYEFKNADEAAEWPVAVELFKLPFVEAVFIAANYIAVSRQQDVEWNGITMELRQLIRDYLNSGREIRATGGGRALGKDEDETPGDEVEKKIRQIIREYVQPAVEQDGGAIQFSSFENGTLTVRLRGACHGCPSASRTLKVGIEQLFQRLFPEVREVVAEEA